jgi:hypothetical protein
LAIAQAWDSPAARAVIEPILVLVRIFCGIDEARKDPFESWPNLFRPQHQVVVAAVIAHANSLPAVKATGFLIDVV